MLGRIHLDLLVDTTSEQESEIARLIGLGARQVDWDTYPSDPDFVVLADPDDNVFCLLSRPPDGDEQQDEEHDSSA